MKKKFKRDRNFLMARTHFSVAYHLSTWQFFQRLHAEKIAGKIIQDDRGKRGQLGKLKFRVIKDKYGKNDLQFYVHTEQMLLKATRENIIK